MYNRNLFCMVTISLSVVSRTPYSVTRYCEIGLDAHLHHPSVGAARCPPRTFRQDSSYSSANKVRLERSFITFQNVTHTYRPSHLPNEFSHTWGLLDRQGWYSDDKIPRWKATNPSIIVQTDNRKIDGSLIDQVFVA